MPHGMWDLSPPAPGTEPTSPALQGRVLTTGPPRKSPTVFLLDSRATFPVLTTRRDSLSKTSKGSQERKIQEVLPWKFPRWGSFDSLKLVLHSGIQATSGGTGELTEAKVYTLLKRVIKMFTESRRTVHWWNKNSHFKERQEKIKHKTISPQVWASSSLPTVCTVHLRLVWPRSSPWPPPGTSYITSPGDLPNPGIKPTSSALAGRFFTAEPLHWGSPCLCSLYLICLTY